MNKHSFILVVMGILFIGWLVYEATIGNVVSIVVLSILSTISLMSISFFFETIRKKQEMYSFMTNAKENLAVMSAMQTLQNKQNQNLLRQVNRLPVGDSLNLGRALEIQEGVFEEIEN